jgi:hypothetical protein
MGRPRMHQKEKKKKSLRDGKGYPTDGRNRECLRLFFISFIPKRGGGDDDV